MEKMTKVKAIRKFFEQVDDISPNGGKEVTTAELRELGGSGLKELGELCAEALGVEIQKAT